ncbi:endonuclease/exonuclease/phosphatase family protein [Nocardia carnea]|uniref:endonuclease/exonuclease/phosphatase family protein n=1 Tax=Nocardia carnea TaxID=37328 RepID=UPI0024543B56|nr:endonuclease/exonuclease/phosphatase family protein [Nocardia carnea]
MNYFAPDQAMLFGSVTAGMRPTSVTGMVRVCALNIGGPSRARAHNLERWLLDRGDDILILSELTAGDGCRELLTCLRAENYTVISGRPGPDGDRYFAAIAIRGQMPVTVVPTDGLGSRIAAVDVGIGPHPLRVVAMYAPTNGMTINSSHRRDTFRRQAIGYLHRIAARTMIVAGDLNVVEPDHLPRLPQFEPHDYRFYTDLIALGLRDAYRELHPDRVEHSWYSSRFGDQRIDHTFLGPDVGVVVECGYDHSTRSLGLSDHAAMATTLSIRTAAVPPARAHAMQPSR